MVAAPQPLHSSRLAELQAKAAEVRKQLQEVEVAIEKEQSFLHAAAKCVEVPKMHHRPSWSLLGSADGFYPSEASTQDFDADAVLADFPKLDVGPICAHHPWDRRECAVNNGEEWSARCKQHVRELGGKAEIPKIIHQIWIGPREPPCLWIDTFRIDYCSKYPDWEMRLWSDDAVATLPMFNAKIYAEEKMWQCKADILRLELLWHHGGIYVDADMVSVGQKSLQPIIDMGAETGFVIAYEPDTKDKQYSVLGNSVIACTPHHPLILMLILYLKQTFHHKRNVIEVFEVTGPLMYTKCLIDCKMPLTIADQELFYPAFHFIPNPDAIDYSRFPKCLVFQFGYTCSGLESYVKRKNRCQKPQDCPFHRKRTLIESFRRLDHAAEGDLYAQVPISLGYLEEFLGQMVGGKTPAGLPLDCGAATFITDGEVVHLGALRRELPGYVDRIRHQAWDVLFFGIESQTGTDEVVLFNVPPGGRPKNGMVCGLIVNFGNPTNSELLRKTLAACITSSGLDPSNLFNAADRLKLWFAVQKYAGTMEEARLWRSMATVGHIFSKLANHQAPIHGFDRHELHGNLMKGWQGERLCMEMKVEANGGITFRSWNDDNSPNCELSSNGSKVDWMKVFYNHQVVFEAANKPIP